MKIRARDFYYFDHNGLISTVEEQNHINSYLDFYIRLFTQRQI